MRTYAPAKLLEMYNEDKNNAQVQEEILRRFVNPGGAGVDRSTGTYTVDHLLKTFGG